LCLILFSLLMAALLSLAFLAVLCVYLLLTLAYSFKLKQIPVFDLIVLAILYTLRLVAGMELFDHVYSPWLLIFSLMMFFSLSAVKRSVELQRTKGQAVLGRGYRVSDLNTLQHMGQSVGVAGIVVFVLYLENEAVLKSNYQEPAWLWMIPALMFVWLCRVWLIANRGELSDDPIVFALKDPISWTIAAISGVALMLVHLA